MLPLIITKIFYFFGLIILYLPFDLLKRFDSKEHNDGANRPVTNIWEKIFLILGKYKKILFSDKFLIKIWEKYNEPQKKQAMEQISPYLKWPIRILLETLNFPNHIPHKTKPGICVKLLSGLIESNISPKNNPTIRPSIDPWIIDHGNNQNKGQ